MKIIPCILYISSVAAQAATDTPKQAPQNMREFALSNDNSSLESCGSNTDCSSGESCVFWIANGDDRQFCANSKNCGAYGRMVLPGRSSTGSTRELFSISCSTKGDWKSPGSVGTDSDR